MKKWLSSRVHAMCFERGLTPQAVAERTLDRRGVPAEDPGTDRVLPALMDWMALAQDSSRSADGGVARDYSLLKGWATSYPETTGYIIPTFLAYSVRTGQLVWRERALRMADWLASIQLESGGFQGGRIDSMPVVPVTFNTGQILIGLAVAEAATGRYREAMTRAAEWLKDSQDADGCWRRHPTPFAADGEKHYETHVAWGLFEAARVDGSRGWAEAGLANLRWVLSEQRADGWLDKCCLEQPEAPLTHTLGYALRGLIEGYAISQDPGVLKGAVKLAQGLMSALEDDGRLPGQLLPGWQAGASWVCLTGTAQVAHSWLLLYRLTGEACYAQAAQRANRYVRRTVHLDGPAPMRGGVKGSFPVDGEYGMYEFLNWPPKFLADSLMLERDLGLS